MTTSVIKDFKEIIREQLEAGSSAASEKFKRAVLPVYGTDRNGKPTHVGTCFLVEIDCKRYLITAAHVLDNAKKTSLWVGGIDKLKAIEGDSWSTVPPSGGREEDHFDFAWLQIDEAFFASLGDVLTIKEEDIAKRPASYKGRVYLCLGYPRSKNKKVNPKTNALRPKRASYFSTWQEMTDLYKDLGASGDYHIAISRRSQSRDDEGRIVNSFGPRGLSGGPLIDLGGMVSMPEIATGITNPPKIAGVLIAHDKKHEAILSVKIEIVVESIKGAL
jgi:hypothetical protein